MPLGPEYVRLKAFMPTWKDVTTIGLALPKTEVSTCYGTPGMKVAGKGFLRLRSEAEGGLLVLCDHDKKAMLLASGDPAFFTHAALRGLPRRPRKPQESEAIGAEGADRGVVAPEGAAQAPARL